MHEIHKGYIRGWNESDRLCDYFRCMHVSSQHILLRLQHFRSMHVSNQHMVQNVNITSALLYVGVKHPSQRKWLIVKGAEGKKF